MLWEKKKTEREETTTALLFKVFVTEELKKGAKKRHDIFSVK